MNATYVKRLSQVAGAVVLTTSASSAFASWNLTDCGGSGDLGTTLTCSNSGTAAGLVLSGYANGRGTSSSPNTTNLDKTFKVANIYDWGSAGLGVVATNENSGDTGPHAMDNRYGIDALMIKFTGGAINLTGLTIGWNGTDDGSRTPYNDSDLSVFAWNGNGAPTALTTLTPNSLASDAGWQLVGNYADVGSGSTNAQSPLGSSLYSSYWLVSAYSSAYGGSGTGLDQGNDAFKLLSIAGNTCSGTVTHGACGAGGNGGGGNGVPEPGSLALMGAALMAFVANRRRKQQAA